MYLPYTEHIFKKMSSHIYYLYMAEQINFPFLKEKSKSYDEDEEAIKISIESQTGEEVKKVYLPKSKKEIAEEKEKTKKLFKEAREKIAKE